MGGWPINYRLCRMTWLNIIIFIINTSLVCDSMEENFFLHTSHHSIKRLFYVWHEWRKLCGFFWWWWMNFKEEATDDKIELTQQFELSLLLIVGKKRDLNSAQRKKFSLKSFQGQLSLLGKNQGVDHELNF